MKKVKKPRQAFSALLAILLIASLLSGNVFAASHDFSSPSAQMEQYEKSLQSVDIENPPIPVIYTGNTVSGPAYTKNSSFENIVKDLQTDFKYMQDDTNLIPDHSGALDILIPADKTTSSKITFEAHYSFRIPIEAVKDNSIQDSFDLNLSAIKTDAPIIISGGNTNNINMSYNNTSLTIGSLTFNVASNNSQYLPSATAMFTVTTDELMDLIGVTADMLEDIEECTFFMTFQLDMTEISKLKQEKVSYRLGGTTLNLTFEEFKPTDLNMEKAGRQTADGLIEWKVTIKPGNTNTTEGIIFQDTFSNQKYKADSLQINGAAPADITPNPASSDTSLKFSFDNALSTYAKNKEISITYKTYPQLNDQNAPGAILFENHASLITPDTNDTLIENNASVSYTPVYMTKTGEQSKSDPKKIVWTLTINENKYPLTNVILHDQMVQGLTLDQNSILISTDNKSFATVDSSKISSFTSGGENSNAGFAYTMGTIDTTYYIQYETTITDKYLSGLQGETTFTNNAWIEFSFHPDGHFGTAAFSHYGILPVGVKPSTAAIRKASKYNAAEHSIEWTITVNPNRVALHEAVITDRINEDQIFVPDSIAVSSSPSSITGPDALNDNTFTVTLPNAVINEKTVTISYKTILNGNYTISTSPLLLLKDVYGGNTSGTLQYTAQNTANLNATFSTVNDITGSASKDQPVSSTILKKVLGTYNYAEKYIPCTITLNTNKMEMPDALIKDELMEGLSPIEDSLEIRAGSTILIKGTDYSYVSILNQETNKITFEISFLNQSADKREITINLNLAVDVDALTINKTGEKNTSKNKFTITNAATLIRNGYADVTANAAKKELNSKIVDKSLVNQSEITNTDRIDYSVLINKAGADLSMLVNNLSANSVVDTLGEGLQLDMSSVTLYRGTVDASGSFDKISATELSAGVDYSFTYEVPSSSSSIFKVSLPTENPTFSYLLTYSADITATKKLKLSNSIEFNAEGASGSSDADYNFNPLASTGGWTSAMAGIKLKKIDSAGNPLSGAVFALYAASDPDTVLNQALSNADGDVLFKIASKNLPSDYIIKEITAPNGYEISAEWKNGVEVSLNSPGYHNWSSYADPSMVVSSGNIHYLKVENYQTPGTITFTKLASDTGNGLADAKFGIYYTTSESEAPFATAVSKADGSVRFTGVNPGKTYYIREINAPAYYESLTDIYEAVLDSNGLMSSFKNVTTNTALAERKIENIRQTGSLLIKKTDAAEAGMVLENAEFILSDAANGSEVKRGITNTEGILQFDDLKLGYEYILKEVTAPEGYVLSAAEYPVTLTRTGLTAKDISNAKKGSLVITKIQADSPDVFLAGAEFSLTDASGSVFTAVTDMDGKAVFSGLLPGETYTLIETKAPDGYNLTENTIVVTMTSDAVYKTVANTKIASNDNSGNNGGGNNNGGSNGNGSDGSREETTTPVPAATTVVPHATVVMEEETLIPPAETEPMVPETIAPETVPAILLLPEGGIQGTVDEANTDYYLDYEGRPRGRNGNTDPLYWISEDGIPLGYLNAENEWIWIDPDNIPLDFKWAPKTGDNIPAWTVIFLLFGAAAAIMTFFQWKKQNEKKPYAKN